MALQPTPQEIQLRMENQALKGRIAQLEAEVSALNTKLQAQFTQHQDAIAALQVENQALKGQIIQAQIDALPVTKGKVVY